VLVDQLVGFGIAVPSIVARRSGIVILVEHLVGIVDAAFDRHGADREVLFRHLGVPERGIDEIEFGVEINVP